MIARVTRIEQQFGTARPADVRSLTATLHAHLDSARRLRLARDRWRLRLAGYRSYSRFVKSPLAQLDLMRPGLQDIKTLAGPEAVSLGRLTARATQAARQLRGVIPPPDLAPIHALLQSACQMASAAVDTRFKAVASGDMATAWNASSAAARGSARARHGPAPAASAILPPRQP